MLLYCYDEWYPYGFDGDCIGGTVMDNAAKVFFTFLGVVGVVAVAVALTKGLRGRRPGTNPGLGSQNTPGAGSFSFSEGSESELSSDENNRQDLGFDSLGLGVAPEPELNSDENNQQGSGFNGLNSSVGSNVDPIGEDDYTGGMPFLYTPISDEAKNMFESLRKKHGKPKRKGREIPNTISANETSENTESPVDIEPDTVPKTKYYFKTNTSDDVEEMELSADTTVKGFKEELQKKYGVENIFNIKVLFAGKDLLDDIAMNALNIGDDDLYVYIRSEDDILLMTARALRIDLNSDSDEEEDMSKN